MLRGALASRDIVLAFCGLLGYYKENPAAGRPKKAWTQKQEEGLAMALYVGTNYHPHDW